MYVYYNLKEYIYYSDNKSCIGSFLDIRECRKTYVNKKKILQIEPITVKVHSFLLLLHIIDIKLKTHCYILPLST